MTRTLLLAIALAASTVATCSAIELDPVELSHWQVQGDVESITEQNYYYDYSTEKIATEPSSTATYKLDPRGQLTEIIEDSRGVGSRTVVNRDEQGRIVSLKTQGEGRNRTPPEGKSLQRDDACNITGLTAELGPIPNLGTMKMEMPVEWSESRGIRYLKTRQPEEEGGHLDQVYAFRNGKLIGVGRYAHQLDDIEVGRIKSRKLFNARGLLTQHSDYFDPDDPKKETLRNSYEYQFDDQGNWTTRIEKQSKPGEEPQIRGRTTRKINYKN